MSDSNVVPLRPLSTPAARHRLDIELELTYTATYFASAITHGWPYAPEVVAQAEAFLACRKPVRRYENGEPAVEKPENAS